MRKAKAQSRLDGQVIAATVEHYKQVFMHDIYGNELDSASIPTNEPWQIIARTVCGPLTDECIEWPFAIDCSGYGSLKFRGMKFNAHRLALILHTGIDPERKDAAHGPCHNRVCVNPLHLSWKTRSGNMLDMKRDGTAGRRNNRKTEQP